jgi:exopolysaccharide biosynthesis polyprenyl glycosylphosphotransferase
MLFLALIATWHLLFSAFKLYHSRRLSARRREILDLLKAITLGTMLIAATALLLDLSMITLPFLIFFWAATGIMLIFSRLGLRRFLAWIRLQGRNLRHLLIVGTNQRAVRFAREIESRPELGYRVLGYVENGWGGNDRFKGNGDRVVADFDGFASLIREKPVDEVVFFLPVKSFYEQISAMAMVCAEQGVTVRYPSDIFAMKLTRSGTGSFAGTPIITHYTGAMRGRQGYLKRLLDIVASSLGLLLLLPVFLLTALLIKVTSLGPVFFVQERVGLNKRRFRLFKFRTMVSDAEKRQAELEAFNEVSGPVFKIKNDPRITRVGRLLRKTSIDEIPQLINVLKGDMSLVGPRPLPVRDYP